MDFLVRLSQLPRSTMIFLGFLFAGAVVFLTWGPEERIDRVLAVVFVLASGSGGAMLPSIWHSLFPALPPIGQRQTLPAPPGEGRDEQEPEIKA